MRITMNRKNRQIAYLIIIVLTILVAAYVAFAVFFQTHFNYGTRIDGIPVGGYSVEKVEKLIGQEIKSYSLQLVEREDATEKITGSSLELKPVFNGEIEQLLEEQGGFGWIGTWIKKQDLKLDRVVGYDETKLEEVLASLSCVKPENQREPEDAHASEYSKEDGYQLVPADYGTTIDENVLKEAVKNAVTVLTETLVLEDAGCYKDPVVLDDDANLLSEIGQMNQYVATTINYDFGEKSEVLDGETIHNWLTAENGAVTIDKEAVEEYVKELGKKYNTAYQPKEFKTSYGPTVTISTGFYGWRIDREAETEQIIEDLKTGGTINREPVYAQTANSHGEKDYGNSYVEINLTAQHLFVYKDGALVVESDFVSGNVSKGHDTPTGAYGLTYKTTDAVLRGQDYETPVKYWMPFAGDVGMHDATWRKTFGGSIYKTNGSHGCINLPLSVAEKIYNTIDKGYAVMVYTLPGTESVAVQKTDAATVVAQIDAIGVVTLDSETAITSARNLYDALSEQAKAYVTNYDVLVAAEASLAALKGETPATDPAADQQPVDQQAPETQDTVDTTQDQQQDAGNQQQATETQQPTDGANTPEEQQTPETQESAGEAQ